MKKYETIFKDLEREILQGHYQPRDFLPAEHQLCQTYGASRDTIRKALDLLVKTGLVQKGQGRGTQVIKREQINFPVSKLTSYQELVQQQGLKSQTNVIAIDKVIVDQKLAQLTGFAPSSVVWRVTRQRVVDGEASVLDMDYLSKSLVPQMTREIAQSSIYTYLEKDLKLAIAYASKEITISKVKDSDKLLLDLGHDRHVVCVRSKVYLTNNRQFQFTESRHKLDKFKFVDFAKR